MVHWFQECYEVTRLLGPLEKSLQWRHNERDGMSNHQCHCLLNCLFRCRSKKTSKLRVTGLCEGNSPVTGEFPTHRPVTQKMFPFDDVIMITFTLFTLTTFIQNIASTEFEQSLFFSVLTKWLTNRHWVDIKELCRHWLRKWFVTYYVTHKYLIQVWLDSNKIPYITMQWNSLQILNVFIHGNSLLKLSSTGCLSSWPIQ